MFWTLEKLNARVKELSEYRYRDPIRITSFRFQLDPEGKNGTYPNEEGKWEERQIGDRWAAKDRYAWIAFDAEIPASWKGKKVLGRFRFDKTKGSGGFEAMLFVNGQAYQGIDPNHQEVFLPESFVGTTVQFRFRLWSGTNHYQGMGVGEHEIKMAQLTYLDEDVDDLYFTARAMLETVEIMDENRAERQELLTAVDRAFLHLDWSNPGSESFYTSIREARKILKEETAKFEKHHSVTVRCIGHTHIDVAWLWQLKHTREKAARSFSTVLRLMEMYPDYIFLQTQPQLYEYIKNDYPELYEQIRARIQEGRWEAGGAMWLESDCNMPSGESLVRQLLYGIRFFQQEFGTECKYLWLPDVFGYNWALPQILKKAGIDTFMTTKISWNQYNRMPHDTFIWRGIDGSEVLTHFITTPEKGQREGSFFYTYNGKVLPYTVQGIWNAYRDKSVNQELLLAYGYGDGGGGVNREMLEMRRRVAEIPGLPKVTTGRVDEYFEKLQERISNTDQYVHTWDGELYLELHRGTYTSQAFVKRMNRKLELLYRETEWLSVLSSLLSSDWSKYPQSALYEGWKIILRNQFHDIIPGSSIHEVYEDCKIEYKEAKQLGDKAWLDSARVIVDEESQSQGESKRYITVFNSASWNRSDLLHVPSENDIETGEWRTNTGQLLEAQKVKSGWIIHTKDIPSMGYTVLEFHPKETSSQSESGQTFIYQENGIETPFYKIVWNENGQIQRLYDKSADREVLANNQLGNVLQVFEDKPKSRHEAWDIDLYYQEKMRLIDNLSSVSLLENGPLVAVVRFIWTYGKSSIVQDMSLYRNSRRIDFKTEVDWHEQRQLLKVAFPVDVRSTEATYDIQFGNVKRPTHWNTSWDYARFETVAHQWADLSERGYGVSLLNDCKYGYDIKDNVLRLSLIKCAKVPDPQADQGHHEFTYSLLPHTGDWLEGDTVKEAWSLNNPLTCIVGVPSVSNFSLFKLSSDHVMIDAVKKAEDSDDIILRIHEFAGKREQVTLSSDLPLTSWQEVDLLERPVTDANEIPVQFTIKPYEIKTFLLKINR